MPTNSTRDVIHKLFGVADTAEGARDPDQGTSAKPVPIRSRWISDIYDNPQKPYYVESITLAVFNTGLWNRGVVVVSPYKKPGETEVVIPTQRPPVEVDDSSVIRALNNLDFFPKESRIFAEWDDYMFTMQVTTDALSGQLVAGTTKNPSVQKLWASLNEVLDQIVAKWNLKGVEELFD